MRASSTTRSTGSWVLYGDYQFPTTRWARNDQVERCYPQMREFLALKRQYDPDEVFQSNWYRHYRDMFVV